MISKKNVRISNEKDKLTIRPSITYQIFEGNLIPNVSLVLTEDNIKDSLTLSALIQLLNLYAWIII